MRIRISHETVYRYREPVFLEPHRIRLRPRSDPTVAVVRYELVTTPGGRALRWHLDVEGNSVASCWFDSPTDRLQMTMETEVVTSLVDPFDFVLDPGAVDLPVAVVPGDSRRLAPYRRRPRRAAEPVLDLASRVRSTSGPGTVAFLVALCREIHSRLRCVRRPLGAPRSPARTLELGEGACRDLAVLLADAARSQGLAARFVSGYLAEPEPPEGHDLHAWAEVWLPGAGWRGIDPSRGVLVDHAYVPIAASVTPGDAAPVTGTYRGTPTGAMDSRITIERSDA